MRLVATLTVVIASLTIMLPAIAADSPQENAIKARQGMMHLRSFNLGPMIAMLKGDIPYDADQASTLASNLDALLAVDMASAWMQGTSTDDYSDDTEALPAIWAADSEFARHHDELKDAVAQLQQVAGKGLKTMAPALKNVAQSCKGCHDDYRED